MVGEESFWRRYSLLFRRIRRKYPGFWEELREVAERHQDNIYTTHGARVRVWPEARNVGVLVGVPLQNWREAAVQTDLRATPEPSPRPMIRVPATPRRDRREEEVDEEDWNDPPPAVTKHDQRREDGDEEGDQLAARRDGPGCWNCDSRAHCYSTCPHPRRAFCYGCGAEGVNLRECARCAEGWRRLGPYHSERGHDRRKE